MSLIITGNKLIQSGVKDIGIAQSPFHYRNSLKETIELPADCEVAVQSVKLNKGESIYISPDDGLYGNFGIDLAKLNDGRTTENTTSMPVWGSLGLSVEGKGEMVSLNQYNDRLSEALKSAFPHPNIAGVASSAPLNSYYPRSDKNYVNGTFSGFDLDMRQSLSTQALNNAGDITTYKKWYNDNADTLTWDASTTKIKSSDTQSQFALTDMTGSLIDYPISLNQGNMRIDLDGVVKDTAGWSVTSECVFGLCRDQIHEDTTGNQPVINFSVHGNLPNSKDNYDNFNQVAMDFGVYFIQDPTDDQNYLRLGQLSVDEDDSLNALCMNEILYYGWAEPYPGDAPVFATAYNLTTNTLGINQFLINVKNEIVSFYYHTGAKSTSDNPLSDAGWTKFISRDISPYFDSNVAVNYKKAYPKPVAQSCWWMYPKFCLPTKSTFLLLTGFSGIKSDGIINPYYNPKYSWNARLLEEGGASAQQVEKVDLRYMNNQFITDLYTYNSVGTNILKNFIFAIIFFEDKKFYVPTDKATDPYTSRKLGYGDIHQLRPDINGAGFSNPEGWGYEPTSTPAIVNSGSLFVRLDNLTQKSINGAVGRPSKILYTLPQQDQSGGTTGILYYEPQDRVYVKLGNPAPITINTFDLSICDENEILATSLQEQTIICLHFRDRPHLN